MRICSVLLALSLLMACNDKNMLDPGNEEEPQPPLEVTVQATTSLTFNPTPATILEGGRVVYTFQSTAHTVIFEKVPNVPPDIDQQTSNANVTRTFAEPGTFIYECGIHDGMNGTVIVVAETP